MPLHYFPKAPLFVIPAKAGIQRLCFCFCFTLRLEAVSVQPIRFYLCLKPYVLSWIVNRISSVLPAISYDSEKNLTPLH